MRECCMSKEDFINSKLKNFVAYLTPFATTDTARAGLVKFSTLHDTAPLFVQLNAIGVESAVAKVCDAFPASDKARVGAYMAMFHDLTS